MAKPLTVHGVFYFRTQGDARDFAEAVGAPTDRILFYGCGWAIQWHRSGPYVGPESLTHPGCRFCPDHGEDATDA